MSFITGCNIELTQQTPTGSQAGTLPGLAVSGVVALHVVVPSSSHGTCSGAGR